MRKTTVVNITGLDPFHEDDDGVYIGRPSKWGNPFRIGPDGNRVQVIAKYRHYILNSLTLRAALPELVGKELRCFCAPLPCHGDVLAEMANELAGRL